MINDVGSFFEREMMMVVRYFEEGKSFKFFEKVDKGKHIPSKKTVANVENMAWDMVLPRLVEYFSQHLGGEKYFIPYVLTWDKGLQQALEMYQAKAMLYDSEKGAAVLISKNEVMKKLEDIVGFETIEFHFNQKTTAARYKAKSLTNDELISLEAKLKVKCIEVLHGKPLEQ